MKGWDARKLSIASVGLAIVFFLALNVFLSSTFTTAQVDLTEDGLYTLSDGTKEVLATVDEPVTLRLFASKALLDQSPGLDTYAKRVQELLEQYVTLSNGKYQIPEKVSVNYLEFNPSKLVTSERFLADRGEVRQTHAGAGGRPAGVCRRRDRG